MVNQWGTERILSESKQHESALFPKQRMLKTPPIYLFPLSSQLAEFKRAFQGKKFGLRSGASAKPTASLERPFVDLPHRGYSDQASHLTSSGSCNLTQVLFAACFCSRRWTHMELLRRAPDVLLSICLRLTQAPHPVRFRSHLEVHE